MKALRAFSLALVLAVGVVLSLTATSTSSQASVPQVMEFQTMVGVPTGLTGTQSPIRGINGGGLPWMLTSGRGELSSTGHLEIHVRGLVLAAGPNVGKNPIASFRGVVSCLDASGVPVNVSTDPFPATVPTGNADIEANLSLPQTCIAPIIFVTSPGGAWFAATGY